MEHTETFTYDTVPANYREKYGEKRIKKFETHNLKGTFYPTYLFIEYGDGRQQSIDYTEISSVDEDEEAFNIFETAAGLRLEKKYLSRDEILRLRNWFGKYCKEKFTGTPESEEDRLTIEFGWGEGDREEAKQWLIRYTLYSMQYSRSQRKGVVACVLLMAALCIVEAADPMLPLTIALCVITGAFMFITVTRWILYQLTMAVNKKNYDKRPQDARSAIELTEKEIIIHSYNNVAGMPWSSLENVKEGDRFFVINRQFIYKGDMAKTDQAVLRNRLKMHCREEYQYIAPDGTAGGFKLCTAAAFAAQILFLLLVVLNDKSGIQKSADISRPGYESSMVQENGKEKTSDGSANEDAIQYVDTPDKESLNLGMAELRIEDCYCDNAVNYSSRFYIENGILYGISANEHGELGRGDTEGHINAKGFYPPYEIARDAKHVALGKYFMVFINEADELWGTGDIPGTEGTMRLTKIMDQVQFVSCSEEAVAVLKKDGTVWCGGTLRDVSGEALVSYNGLEQKLSHMKYVAAGSNTMAAISDDNVLWIWGDNSHGQCGRSAEEAAALPEPVQMKEKVKVVWMDALMFRSKEQYPLYDRQEPLSYVGCRTYIQQTDGEVLACGEGLVPDGGDTFVRVMVQQIE